MVLRIAVVLSLLLFVYVDGQTKYCCTPMQWESVNEFNMGQITSGSKKAVYTEGVEAVSVDQINHKIASLSTLNTGGFKVNVQVIQLFDKALQYVIQSGECKQSPLPPWSPRCVPDSAHLQTRTYFGVGSTKLDVDVYMIQSGPNTNYLNVGRADCSPVFQSGYGSAQGISAMSIKTYGNITLGIRDTSVFNIPAICNNATMVSHINIPHHGML